MNTKKYIYIALAMFCVFAFDVDQTHGQPARTTDYRGMILVNSSKPSAVWYVRPQDGKRYPLFPSLNTSSLIQQYSGTIPYTYVLAMPWADFGFKVGREKDSDSDGFSDYFETKSVFGQLYLNKNNKDSDNNGVSDKAEFFSADFIQKTAKKQLLLLGVRYMYAGNFLQIPEDRHIWYMHPKEGKLYFLRDGKDLTQFIKSVGKKVSRTVIDQIPAGKIREKNCGVVKTGDKSSLESENCMTRAMKKCLPAHNILSQSLTPRIQKNIEYKIVPKKDNTCTLEAEVHVFSQNDLAGLRMSCDITNDKKFGYGTLTRNDTTMEKLCTGNLANTLYRQIKLNNKPPIPAPILSFAEKPRLVYKGGTTTETTALSIVDPKSATSSVAVRVPTPPSTGGGSTPQISQGNPPINTPAPQQSVPAQTPSPINTPTPASATDKPQSPYRAKLTSISCDTSVEQFKQTGQVTCGRIKWKLFSEHAALMTDPFPYLMRYDQFYGFLQDLLGDEPSGKQIIFEEKEGEVTLNANWTTSTIRLVPEWVKDYFARLANSENNRLSGSLAHEMGHIFTLKSPNKDILMWGPPLLEAYADIPALFGYLAAIESVPGFQKDFFYWDGYCEKLEKPRYCDEGFSSVAEYISVGHLRDLQEYIDRGETFDTLFPVPDTAGEVHKRAGKFSTMLMNMYLDFVKQGKGLQFYNGLKSTLQLYQTGALFPESLKTSVQSRERLGQKSNLFIFLLSSGVKEDLSSRFEGYRFTVSPAIKKALADYGSENYDPARLQQYMNAVLEISPPSQAQAQTPLPAGVGTGLEGLYFSDENLNTFVTIRVDKKIDFDWGWNTPPATGMAYDHYSIRWTGFVEPRYTDTYTFYTIADDGARLWVNNTKLIDDWTVHGPTELSGVIKLEAGKKYPIKLEYYDWQYGASIQLLWSSANQKKEVVPQTQLYDPAKVTQ